MIIEGLSLGGDELIDANITDGEAHEIHQLEDQSK
jgi:hypothetical protein